MIPEIIVSRTAKIIKHPQINWPIVIFLKNMQEDPYLWYSFMLSTGLGSAVGVRKDSIKSSRGDLFIRPVQKNYNKEHVESQEDLIKKSGRNYLWAWDLPKVNLPCTDYKKRRETQHKIVSKPWQKLWGRSWNLNSG